MTINNKSNQQTSITMAEFDKGLPIQIRYSQWLPKKEGPDVQKNSTEMIKSMLVTTVPMNQNNWMRWKNKPVKCKKYGTQ
ncbi:MAG: hypothetical protein R2877_04160 [Bdellovibrionota bacterium]